MGLTVTITDAGRAALRNAAGNGTNAVTIAAVGLSSQAFTPGEAIPAEIKRLTTISGGATAADTIHVTVLDSGGDDYSVYGFALYLSDGTLFASYGQSTVIVEKSAQAMMQLALDVRFVDVAASSISFGDANFVNPAATEDTLGVVMLASDDDVTAGTDAQKAVTPAAIKKALSSVVQQQIDSATLGVTRFGHTTAGPFQATDTAGVTAWMPQTNPASGQFQVQNMAMDQYGNLILKSGNGGAQWTFVNKGTTDAIQEAIAEEVTRAQGAEQDIGNSLTVEVRRAQQAEQTLATKLADETARAEAAEATAVQQQIDSATLGVTRFGHTTAGPFQATDTAGVTAWMPQTNPASGQFQVQNMAMDQYGNLILKSGNGGALTGYSPTAYGNISGGYYVRIGNILIQAFSAGVLNAGDSIAFPVAFSGTPTVSTTVDNNRDGANRPVAINPTTGTVTATGFKINIAAISGANQPAGTGQVWVFAMGPA